MPTLLTADSDDPKYIDDQVKHFFDTVSYEVVFPWPKEEKERLFKMLTDHEALSIKLLGEGYKQSLFCIPEATRNGVDNYLTREYKEWLEKQK
jgi:hypothetical protein